MGTNVLETICATAIGTLLIWTAVVKTRFFADFHASVQGYGFIEGRLWVKGVSVSIIAAEFSIGVALMTGRFLPWPAIAGLALLGGFTLAVAIALLTGKSAISCGCVGLGRNEPVGWFICARNLGLACLLVPRV